MWPRRRRTPDVQKLRRKGDLTGLQAALAHADPTIDRDGTVIDMGVSVRVAAVQALADIEATRGTSGGPELPPEIPLWLAGALRDESHRVGSAAATALGTLGSRAVMDELVWFLAYEGRTAHPEVRTAALEAVCASTRPGLTELWCRKVVEGRRGRLDDTDRREFTELLAADTTDQVESRLQELLIPLLEPDADGIERPRPAEAILSWCMPADVGGLARALEGHDVTEPAVRLAGLSGSQSLLEPLARLLEHPAPTVRREAVAALGELCDTATVLPLLGATTDPDVTVRRRAVAALDSLGSAGVTAAMAMLAQRGPALRSATEREPAPDLVGEKWGRTLGRLAGGPACWHVLSGACRGTTENNRHERPRGASAHDARGSSSRPPEAIPGF